MKQKFIVLILMTIYLGMSAQVLHIYGGQNNQVYLGCINCNKFDSKSIWNAYGNYGSIYSSTSIWNEYGSYGGSYSQYSPFNNYTSTPPIIVDNNGGFYGYLTSNQYMSQKANFSLANTICKYWKVIKEDVSNWYDEIF